MKPIVTILLLAFSVAACAESGEPGGEPSTVADPGPSPSTPTTSPPPDPGAPGLVIVPAGGVDLYAAPESEPFYRPAEGLIFPVLAEDGNWLHVITTCNTERWVRRADVEIVPARAPGEPGQGFDLASAVIVLDPGHGGRDRGAKGPSGSNESDANLAIGTWLRDRLLTGQDIDWETGHVRPGDQYPAVAAVWMTRGPDSPDAGDIELGLAYRAAMSNSVGADVLVSLHNNTTPSTTQETPGSDIFYSVGSEASDRLASLIHEELVRGLAEFGDSWGAATVTGAKARVDADTGEDFYGLLRRTEAPSVIVEGMYISNPPEELLLQSEILQRAYADAVYRGLVRFLTSDELGTEIIEPEPFSGSVGSPSTASCVVPAQG